MAAGKAPPAVVKKMLVLRGAHGEGYQGMAFRSFHRATARKKVRPRAPNRILDHISQKDGDDEGREKAEDGDMGEMCPWS